MRALADNPMFGIIISILAYEIGLFIYRRAKLSVFNPLLIAIVLVSVFLILFKIDPASYDKGGELISFFLGPATVILAVPLYKQLGSLKANIVPIIAGVLAGSLTAVLSVVACMKIFKLDTRLGLSLVPKSITTPIGIELSRQIGGIPPVTVAAIIITGIIGSVIGPFLCKAFKIEDKIAVGLALGTSAHAIGTTKAVELGETEGAMSSLAIGIAGVFTVFLAVLLVRLLL